jgi:hypothetical protein
VFLMWYKDKREKYGSPPEVWDDFQFGHRCLKIHNVRPPPKVSKFLNVGTLSVKPSLIGRKVVTCVSRDHCSLHASQNAPISLLFTPKP